MMDVVAMEVATLHFIWDLIVFVGIVGALGGILVAINKVESSTLAPQAVSHPTKK